MGFCLRLTCLACRSDFGGGRGLEAGVTGALRLPPDSAARTDASHFIVREKVEPDVIRKM